MKILVEILHPAHVHVFKNAIRFWRDRGDEVLILSREKDCANELLDALNLPYRSISRLRKGSWRLLTEMVVRDGKMLHAALRFKPDVLTGIMGVTVAQVGKIIGKPAVVFYDTENAGLTNRIVYPLAHSVCTPECYQGPVNGHHVTYPGYHELAYLHPNWFQPDPEVVRRGGVDPEAPFFLLRLVSWQASHDIGEQGLTLPVVRELVETLQEKGRVLISSEKPLPEDLKPHAFACPALDLHHFMAFSRMVIGESATMASEAAVLGIPAIFISDTGRGYTDELEEKYQLVFNYTTQDLTAAHQKVKELLNLPSAKDLFQQRRQEMLQERVDTTTWMVEYLDQTQKGSVNMKSESLR